jgi:hypothetical protein
MKMTALEMATNFKWAILTVSFNYGSGYCGHVDAEGRTRIVRGEIGSAVWVEKVALSFDTIVRVEKIGEEAAKVSVYSNDQKAEVEKAA